MENKETIPRDLYEVFEHLKTNSNYDDLKKWSNASEEDCHFLHHGPGTAMRNDWGLWGVGEEKTVLYEWFNTIGIAMGDDLSGIIYTSFHRHMNDKDIDLHEQVKVYWKHWSKYDAPEYLPHNIDNVSDEYMALWEDYKKEL